MLKFNPQVNDENPDLTPPTTTPPTYVDNQTFQIGNIILYAPDFNNQIYTKYEQFSQETLGGDFILLRSQAEIIDRKITVVFESLTTQQKDDLLAFMLLNLGKRITVIDYENQQWSVYLINPTEPFNQIDACHWSIRFEFEGDRL